MRLNQQHPRQTSQAHNFRYIKGVKINVTPQEQSHYIHNQSKDNSVQGENPCHPCLMAPVQLCPFATCSSSTKQTQRCCCNRHVPFSLFIPDVFPCRFSEIQLTVHKLVPKEEQLHINHRSCWAVKCRFMLARKKSSNRL